MKIAEVTAGEKYIAKVSGSLTTVQVLAIRDAWSGSGKTKQVIDVINERTGRKLTFRSAARLRKPARKEA